MNVEYPYSYAPDIFMLALVLLVLPLALFYIGKAQVPPSRYRVVTNTFLFLTGIVSAPLLLWATVCIFGAFEGPGMWYSLAFPATMIELGLFVVYGISLLIRRSFNR